MSDQPSLFDNLGRQVLAANPDHPMPDVQDPQAGTWWRPVEIVKVSEGRL